MRKFMSITAFALTIVATSALTSLIVTKNIDSLGSENDSTDVKISSPVSFAKFNNDNTARPADFTYAAEKSVEAVVHVKTKIDVSNRYSMNIAPFFDFFFEHTNEFATVDLTLFFRICYIFKFGQETFCSIYVNEVSAELVAEYFYDIF